MMKKKRRVKKNFLTKPKNHPKTHAKKTPLTPKTPSLYAQLRQEIRQEEKFLFLKENNLLKPSPNLTSWELAKSYKVSFVQSQAINIRTNRTLGELAQARDARIAEQKTKLSWSLRKQRARIRRVRGSIDEVAYQAKLQASKEFSEKLSNYQGKLAQEQYWTKKFQASPISLAQAELARLRLQPEPAPSHNVEAAIFAFKERQRVPPEVFSQPWLSTKPSKTATFSSIFGGARLRKVETTRDPLLTDQLQEYQYKVNFYQLFGRLPREKEIRKFVSINWAQEQNNYQLLWKVKDRLGKPQLAALLGQSTEQDRWALIQKQILNEGRQSTWWKQAGEEELALITTRLHNLGPQTKFWATEAKRWQDPEFARSLLPKGHPDYRPYIYTNSENFQLDQLNRNYLNQEELVRGQKIASSRWINYLEGIQEQLLSQGISSQLHLYGLYSSFILSKCSVHCQCNVIGGTEYYETESSMPWCEICRVFNSTTKFIFADQGSHPPLAPYQCSYINSSQWGREEYGKPYRWEECGNILPQRGETWHHNFDAWHKGGRGWGCHFGFPQVRSGKQKSRSTIVEMEW